jgi:hypothetical protein
MKALFTAMAKAFPEMEAATKDKVNPAFKSKYADLGSVIEAIKPALSKHGLFFAQITHEQTGGVCIETIVCHTEGEQMTFGKLFVPAMKQDAQGYGSALTYARRYSLMSAFGIPAEDDDGNAAAKSKARQAANDPFEDDLPRAKPVKLTNGPHQSKTALWTAYKAFVSELHGCGDLDEFEAFLASDDVKILQSQVTLDAPTLAHGGENMPEEFEPMLALISRLRTEHTATANEGSQADLTSAG